MTGNVSTRNLTTLYGSTGTVTPVQSNVGNASIGSQNLTTLYRNSTAVIPQYPYGNANVESFLAVGSDPGGNTVGNITSSGQISATGNIITNGYFVGNFAGNITGNVTAPGANTDVLFNFQGNVGASNQFTFNIGSNTLTVANTVVAANVNTPTVYSQGMQTQGSDYVQMQYSNGVTLPVSPYDIGVGSWFYLDPGGGVFQSNTTGTLQTVVLGNDGTVSATGNITAPYYFGNGSQLTGLPATYSNANVSNFLANGFGSNTITTTGNITAGYFLGNGSQLTGLPATYSNANVSNFLANFGSNAISTSGNVTAGYFIGNGAFLTDINASNIVGAYGNANVSNFLANFGSNSISTSGNISAGNVLLGDLLGAGNVTATGNVTGANINGDGSGLSNITGANVSGTVANATYAVSAGSAGTANLAQYVTANAQANITSVGTLTGLNASGNISTSGNITGAYFLGNGSQLTGLPSTAPGGTNTQVQFNDGSAFAGNANLTFDKVTGNFTAGNIVTVGSVINNKNAWAFSPANTLLSTNNARIIVGNAWDGNAAVQYDPINVTRGSRLAVMDKQAYDYTANSLQPGTRLLTSYFWLDLANTTVPAASGSRNSAGAFVTNVGNGISAQTGLGFYGVQSALVIGNASGSAFGNVGNIGNVTLNIGVGQGSFVNLYNGSTANNAIGTYSSLLIASAGGVMANSIGYAYSRADAANNLSTWNIGYFHPDNVSTFGSSMSGNARLATNYYAFYNKDNFADVQLGSLRSFHYYTANVLATGGSLPISKLNGPYQTTTGNLTANLDISAFQNFATSNTVTAGTNTGTKLASDVVTLLVPMGATPYSINMPTGNSAIKYVNGVSNVTGTANSLVQIQITGSNVGGTVQYLVNVADSGGTPATYGNAQVASFLAAFGSNTISSTGNITTTGNISGNYILGNGSQLTGIVSTYGNANVVANLAALGSNPVSTTGNVTASYFVGNGSLLTDIVSTYSNANVASFLTVFGSNTISSTGNITTTANVAANYFLGNGSQLTGLPATYSNANVVSLLAAFGSNVISTTGNITGGNINASVVSASGNITSDNTVIAPTLSAYGNVNTANVYATGLLSSTGNINTNANVNAGNVIANLVRTGSLTATGNITGGNLAISTLANIGNLSVTGNTNTGNIYAAFVDVGSNLNVAGAIFALGSEIQAGTLTLSGNILMANTANITTGNVIANANIFGGNIRSFGTISSNGNITTLANVSAGNLLTTGAFSTTGNISASNINTNQIYVTGTVHTDNIVSDSGAYVSMDGVSATGNIFADGYVQTVVGLYTSGNVVGNNLAATTGNLTIGNIGATGLINTSGRISATGNITSAANISGSYILGNGSQLTGIPTTYGNANVVALLADFNANNISMPSGTITASVGNIGLITSAGGIGTLSLSATSNVTGGNINTGGRISATGNITSAANISGSYILGNGSQLTGVISSYGNANVVALLTDFGGNSIGNVNNITAASGNINIITAVSIGTGFLSSSGNVVGSNLVTGGFVTATGNITGNVFLGNGSQLTGIVSTYGNANVVANLAALGSNPVSTTGNVTASYFVGNGSLLTAITGANVTGTVANATYAITAGSATTAGTVTTNAQPNITSVGTLTSLSASGNITGSYFLGNGSQLTGLPATYGNANVAANLAAFATNPISTSGNITAGYFIGNGSALTGVSATLPANITGNVFTSVVNSYGNATGNISPDISLGSIQTMTLTGNITLNSLSNVTTGQTATFIMTQDATGNRLLTSTWKFASNVRTLSTAANATDMISVSYIGNTYYASLIRGFQ